MELKSKFKPACKKIWEAFNSWRKRGMWFRVTVLLIIGISMNIERLYTKDYVPLINEWVWIACRAIRMGSEPRVTYSQLRYLHAEKSRQLQKQLIEKVEDGSLRLNADEMKLLRQNTLDASYNKLFALAKRARIIPESLSLRQAKRAMLDKSLKLTAERYDYEYANIEKEIYTIPPLSMKQLQLNFLSLWRAVWVVLPLPIIPVLPWLILCLTLGFCGARSKSQIKFVIVSALTVIMTFVWLYFSAYINENWTGWRAVYRWRLLGISVFFAIWALIGSILGKRLYNYSLKYNRDAESFIALLLTSGIILLMAGTCFKTHHAGVYSWWVRLPGYYLLFRNFAFSPYFITVGVGILFYALLCIFKAYAQELDKYKWAQPIKYLIIILLLAKLVFSWYPLCK